jgi:hypothetical protein
MQTQDYDDNEQQIDPQIDPTKAEAEATPREGNGSSMPAAAPKMPDVVPPGYKLIDPYEQFAQEESGGVFFGGDYLNFNGQTGALTKGEKKDPIDPHARFLCNMQELHRGWIKMVKGKPVDRKIGRVFDGYTPPPREELDDYEEHCWPINDKGKPEDPWKPVTYLPMRWVDTDEIVVFGPFAKTQRTAVGDFVRVYQRAERNGRYPVVVIKVRDFTNQSKGRTYVPVFEIVDWQFWDGQPAPEPTSVLVPIAPPAKTTSATATPAKALPKRGDLDDEIPF